MGFIDRLQHGWNAFIGRDPTRMYNPIGNGNYRRPDRVRMTRGNERSIVTSVYNRISLDVASIPIIHARLDDNNKYIETIDSYLNECLTLSANVDQTAKAFIQDTVLTMFDEGVVAIVPVDTTLNPTLSGSYDIQTLRAGKIKEWFPSEVRVDLYNEKTATHEEIILPKSMVAIVQNPFYAVMNEPNSTLQRLIRKLNLLDAIDEQNGAGKLDLIIQLPYVIKTEARRQQAENRRKDIEMQLAGSKYGIAYTDGTEHITQLNRSVDNQLMSQIEYLTNMLYSQLGLTTKVFDGTADEREMLNYYNRTIEPILSAICDEMKRKFLTKTARTKKQTIRYYQEPFKLVATNELAELVDKFTRNEVMTSNEFRQIIGLKPSNDPRADELRNKNLSEPNGSNKPQPEYYNEEEEIQNGY